jgi:hypothetical protein
MKTSLKIALAAVVIALTVASCWMRTPEKTEESAQSEEVKIDTGAVDIDSEKVVIDTLAK